MKDTIQPVKGKNETGKHRNEIDDRPMSNSTSFGQQQSVFKNFILLKNEDEPNKEESENRED